MTPAPESAVLPAWSFEVYPPRGATPGVDQVVDHVRAVVASCSPDRAPSFCSVTTRVGGWQASADIADRVQRELGVDAALHVCWAGESAEGRRAVLDRIVASGVWGALALRGDAPSPEGSAPATGEDAARGVASRFARVTAGAKIGSNSRAPRVLVAAHPGWWPRLSPLSEQHRPEDEAAWVKRKVDAAEAAGAVEAAVITQVCFDAARMVDFVVALRALGCDAPVYAGVMVARDAKALRRVAAMAGVEPPPGIDERFGGSSSAGSALAGEAAAGAWLQTAAAGAPVAGIHFFGMNNTDLLCESVRVMDALVRKNTDAEDPADQQ
jgi:methylenetetrahydrofolate reductase (NADPH)